MPDNFVIKNGVLESYLGNNNTVNIPADVTRIGTKAFLSSNIQSISFEGNNLKSIDDEAFGRCTNLESIVIPDGVVQIGSRAFSGCSSLEYICIPDSVLIVGNHILENCNKNLLILGNKQGEAGRIAKKYNLVIKSNVDQTLSAYAAAKKTRASLETRSFDLLGENVICSNSLSTYHNNVEYYSQRKECLYRAVMKVIPATIYQSFGDTTLVLEAEKNTTFDRLFNQGVFIKKKTIDRYLYEPVSTFMEAVNAILKVHKALVDEVNSGISQNRDALFAEAERKVTGLSYGVVGGALDMIAYSIDDFAARQKQRSEAYADAEQKAVAFQQQYTSKAAQIYAEFIAKSLPSVRNGTDAIIDALCYAENEQLMKAGIIDAKTISDLDIPKSVQLMESVLDSTSDNSFVVALALKKYPCNIAALVYAYEHGYHCEGLDDLVSFLQLKDKINAGTQESKKRRMEALTKKIVAAESGNIGVTLILENKSLLDECDIRQLLSTLAKTISPMIEKLSPTEKDKVVDSYAYWKDLLSQVITENNWNFFEIYGIHPVVSIKIPNTIKSYMQLMDWVAERVRGEIDQAERYEEYLKKYPEVAALKANKARRNEVQRLIDENSFSIKYRLTVFGVVVSVAIVVISLLSCIASPGENLNLKMIMLFGGWIIGLILFWIAYKMSKEQRKLFDFEDALTAYKAAKKEGKELDKQIKAAYEAPPFVK